MDLKYSRYTKALIFIDEGIRVLHCSADITKPSLLTQTVPQPVKNKDLHSYPALHSPLPLSSG